MSLTEISVAPEQPSDVPGHGAVAGGAQHPRLGLHLGDHPANGPEAGARDEDDIHLPLRDNLLGSGDDRVAGDSRHVRVVDEVEGDESGDLVGAVTLDVADEDVIDGADVGGDQAYLGHTKHLESL